MSDLFGRYQSQQSRSLARIDSTKYPDTNKDFESNLRRLNGFVDYISQYLQQMQKGVDQATQGPLTNARDILMNVGSLLGGGALLNDIDLGDLQYYLPAIGALFGFNNGQPFPINLFYAAEHFLLGYIIPLDSFAFVIEDLIAGWAEAFGLSPEFMESISELLEAIQNVTTDVVGFLQVLMDLLGVFGIDTTGEGLGVFGDIWHAISKLLGGLDLKIIGELSDPILDALAPWISTIADAVDQLDTLIKAFSGGVADLQGILNFTSLFTGVIDFLSPDFDANEGWAAIIAEFFGDILNPANWGELFTELTGGIAGSNPLTDLGNFLKGQLQGQINPNRLGAIPLTAIGNFAANLLDNPSFLDANSIANPGNFVYDGTDGNGQLGCAKVVANGTTKTLVSNWIYADPGATFNLGSDFKWENLVVAGASGVRINVLAYLNNTLIQTTNIASGGANGNQAWGTATVPYTVPNGVNRFLLQLQILPVVTSGTVKFDNGLVRPTRLLQLSWISGLLGYLSKLNPLTGFLDATGLENMSGMPNIPDGLNKIPLLGMLVDATTNTLSGASQTGQQIAGAGLELASETMENLYEMLTANVRKVQALETEATENSLGGRKFNINFADYPNGAFPSGLFNLAYSGPGSSSLVISGGKAAWNKVNDGYRRCLMQFPQQTLTSFQIVRGTMASPPEQGSNVRIWSIGRMNALGTDYVFARGYCTGFLSYKGDIGVVRGGVETIWASNVSLTWSLDLRVIMGVGNNPRRHQVLSGDTIVWDGLEPSDPTKQSYIDSNHLWWGAITETNGQQVPGNVAGASVVDNAPPAVVGTTFRASRRVGTDQTISSGQQPVPNNFYETVEYISPDLTYRPGTNCELEITKQGTYIVMWRCFHGNFATGSGGVGLLWKKPSGGAWGPVARSVWGTNPINVGLGVMADSTDATCGMAMVPMNPGDVLRPGFVFTANMSNTGDTTILADGSQSWFAVARVGN